MALNLASNFRNVAAARQLTTEVKLYATANGVLSETGKSLLITGSYTNLTATFALQDNASRQIAQLQLKFVDIFPKLLDLDALAVDNAENGGDVYRSVLNNAKWKEMYRIKSRNMWRIFTDDTVGQEMAECCPCFSCGFLILTKNVQIDHHKPQSGGGDQAIIKVLRHMGLTSAPGKGQLATKGGMAVFSGASNAHPRMVPSNRNTGQWNVKPSDINLVNRYTLSDLGVIVLSIAIHVAGGIEKIRLHCLNSYINLRPMCAACNGNKSNKLKAIA